MQNSIDCHCVIFDVLVHVKPHWEFVFYVCHHCAFVPFLVPYIRMYQDLNPPYFCTAKWQLRWIELNT